MPRHAVRQSISGGGSFRFFLLEADFGDSLRRPRLTALPSGPRCLSPSFLFTSGRFVEDLQRRDVMRRAGEWARFYGPNYYPVPVFLDLVRISSHSRHTASICLFDLFAVLRLHRRRQPVPEHLRSRLFFPFDDRRGRLLVL